jgi:hypothetical protein
MYATANQQSAIIRIETAKVYGIAEAESAK